MNKLFSKTNNRKLLGGNWNNSSYKWNIGDVLSFHSKQPYTERKYRFGPGLHSQEGKLGSRTLLIHKNMTLPFKMSAEKCCGVLLNFFPPLFCPTGQMMEHTPQPVSWRSSVCESSWREETERWREREWFRPTLSVLGDSSLVWKRDAVQLRVCACVWVCFEEYHANKISLPSAVPWISLGPSLCPVFLPARSTSWQLGAALLQPPREATVARSRTFGFMWIECFMVMDVIFKCRNSLEGIRPQTTIPIPNNFSTLGGGRGKGPYAEWDLQNDIKDDDWWLILSKLLIRFPKNVIHHSKLVCLSFSSSSSPITSTF